MNYKLLNGDCLELLKNIPDKNIDLVITDPPYQLDVIGGGKNNLSKKMKAIKRDLMADNLVEGFNVEVLSEIVRVMRRINLYIWCNDKQIPMYIDFFIKKHKCRMDILMWVKTNAIPAYNNHYIKDKEYCLYFRGKGARCSPTSYQAAKTYFLQPINQKDKKIWEHPTIKPLNIIQTILENSSNEGDIILDPFMGSGTTGVACAKTNRNFIGMEINKKYCNIANQRIEEQLLNNYTLINLF